MGAALAALASNCPRVRVAALIVHDGKVVLVRHRTGDCVYHLLPGGGVDYRETLENALIRELAEETGLEIVVGSPVILSDTIDPSGPRHVINIVFTATVVGGSITDRPADSRVEAVELVEPSALKDLDLRPPCADDLARVLAQGDQPTSARYLGSLFSRGR